MTHVSGDLPDAGIMEVAPSTTRAGDLPPGPKAPLTAPSQRRSDG